MIYPCFMAIRQVIKPSLRPRIPPPSAWKIRRSPASRTTSFPQGMGATWCNGDMMGIWYRIYQRFIWGYHGIFMEYSWNIHGIFMEYSWNIHGIFMEYSWNIYIYMLVNTRQSWLAAKSDHDFSQQKLRFGSGISQPTMFDDTEAWGKQHCIPSGNLT